jgi:hypothetical protein
MADYGPRDDAETAQFIFSDTQKAIRDAKIVVKTDVLPHAELDGQQNKYNCEYVLGTKQSAAQIVRCGKPGKAYNNEHLSIPMRLCDHHRRRMAIMLQRRDDICNIKAKCSASRTMPENGNIMKRYIECSKAETAITVGQQGGRVMPGTTVPSLGTRKNLDACMPLVNL